MKKIILIFLVLLCFGCSKDYVCEVKSDTTWWGNFGNRTVDGEGWEVVDIPDDPPECVIVQKETKEGFLSIQIFEKGGHKIFAPKHDYEKITTTAEYGVVTACSK